jgi:hypothetical protein
MPRCGQQACQRAANISEKSAWRVLDLSQKDPIWASLALALYEC